jgi:hypothetical protein
MTVRDHPWMSGWGRLVEGRRRRPLFAVTDWRFVTLTTRDRSRASWVGASSSRRYDVTAMAGVIYGLPLAMIALASVAGQWNDVLPSHFTLQHYVGAVRGAIPGRSSG